MSLNRIAAGAVAALLLLTALAPSALAASSRARKSHERLSRTAAKPSRLRAAALLPAKATRAAAFDDCQICHDNCLAGSLACIAISAITACAPCALVCLGAQAVCQVNCNKTTACKGTGTIATEESAN